MFANGALTEMRTVEEDAVPGEGNTANVPSKAPQAEPDMLLNLSVVLPYMAYRKRIRYFTGEYKASNPYRMAFLLLILLFLWSLQSFFLQQTDQELNFGVILSLSYSMPEGTALGGGAVALNAINYGLMIVCLVLVSVHVTTFESPFITMMGLVAIVLFLVVLGRRLDFSQNHSGDIEASSTDEANAYSLTQDVIMQAFVYLSLLHMLGSAIIRRLVPWLVRRNSILACAGILDRRDLVDPATATALIALPPGYSLSPERRLVACYLRYMEPWYMWWLPIVGRETITFVGEVDGSGHPSGYGEWRDSAWHGEHLTGFWHAGKPAGPFRSRETGSASSLVNLRVAYFRNRGEAIGRAACLPKLTPLQFGIVACEVTTSGVWFKSLPRLRELLPPIDIAEGLEAEREAAEAEGRLPAAAATAAAAAARATSRWRWWPWRGRGKGGASGERVAGHGNGPSDDPQQCAVAMLGPEVVAAAGGAAAAAARSPASSKPPRLQTQQTRDAAWLEDAKSTLATPGGKHGVRLRSALAAPSYAAAATTLDALELARGPLGWGAVASNRAGGGGSSAADTGLPATLKPLPRYSLRKSTTSGLSEGPARAARGGSVAVAVAPVAVAVAPVAVAVAPVAVAVAPLPEAPAAGAGNTASADASAGAASASTALDDAPCCGDALVARVPLSQSLAAIDKLQAQLPQSSGLARVVESVGNAFLTVTAAAQTATAAAATAATAALTPPPPPAPPPAMAPMAALEAAEQALLAPTLMNPAGGATTATCDAAPAGTGGEAAAETGAEAVAGAETLQGNFAATHTSAAGNCAPAHTEALVADVGVAGPATAAAAGSVAPPGPAGTAPPVTAPAAAWGPGAAPRVQRLPRLVSMLMPMQPAPTTSVASARRQNGRAAAATAALIGLRAQQALVTGSKQLTSVATAAAAAALNVGRRSGIAARQAPGDVEGGRTDEDYGDEGDVFGQHAGTDGGRLETAPSSGSRKDASNRSNASSNRSARGPSRTGGLTRPLAASSASGSSAAGFHGAAETPGSRASAGPGPGPVERRALASFIRTTKPVVPGSGGGSPAARPSGDASSGVARENGDVSRRGGASTSGAQGGSQAPSGAAAAIGVAPRAAASTAGAATSNTPAAPHAQPAAAAATLKTFPLMPPPPPPLRAHVEPPQPQQAATTGGGSPSEWDPPAPSDWRLSNVLSPPDFPGRVALPLVSHASAEHTSGNLPGLDPLDPNALPPTLPPTSVDAAGGGAAGACVGRGGDLSRPPEAFLFVHGLGVDLHKALRHYAQMMALLKFPPHISPMLFAWPSSIAVGYFFARYRAAERPETGLALASAVRALAADGFAGLHILVHSMGTRVLMNALPHLEAILAEEAQRGGAAATEAGAASAARPGGEGVGGGGGGMKLLTVTICNPDYGLRPFVREMGFRLRALCPIVTIYGDTADGALGLSEVVNAMARPVIRTRRWMRYMLGRGKRGRRSQAQGVGEQCQPAGQPEQGGEAAASGVPAQVVAGTGAGAGAAAHTKGRTGGHQQSVSPDEVRIDMATGMAAAMPAPPAAPCPPAPAPFPPPAPPPAAAGSGPLPLTIASMPQAHAASTPASPNTSGSLHRSRYLAVHSLPRPPLPTADPAAAGPTVYGGGGGDAAAGSSSDESYASFESDSEASFPHLQHGCSQPLQPEASPPRDVLGATGAASTAAARAMAAASQSYGAGYDVEAAAPAAGHGEGHGQEEEEEEEEEGAKELAWWCERVVHYRRRLRKPVLYGWLEKSLGKRVYQITDPVTRVPLDLDVIDLSFLASNVNAMRHTHFALNREMLDDLYDVVVLRRRARERMWRLEHITGNVFSIAVCPYYISTKNL